MLSNCGAGQSSSESFGLQGGKNQWIIKEINPEYSLEGVVLKLKLQYLAHLMQRANSLQKILVLGKMEGKRRRGWQRMRWLAGIIDSMDMSLSKPQEMVQDREAWGAAVRRVTKNRTQLTNWTKTMLSVILGRIARSYDNAVFYLLRNCQVSL